MKILFLTKRRPQNRDLFTRPYGRFYNIPRLMAEKGADVHLILGSYEAEQEFAISHDGMTVYSHRMFPNLLGFHRWARDLSRGIRPDVVVGLSDTWFGILAATIAERCDAKLVIDAYDNYEAYMPRAKPLHWLWRRALGKAHGLSAAGPELLGLLCNYNDWAQRVIVPMAADTIFMPRSSIECRAILKLPVMRKLIGYLGSADSNRGFDLFLEAIDTLLLKRDDFDLVLSGRTSVDTNIPSTRLHRLGYVADELMPLLLNSCNLLVCVNKSSAFGNYSYPVKIYEALACEKPVLASDTAPARWILKGNARHLAAVGDAPDLATKMASLLDHPTKATDPPGGWENSAEIFGSLLLKL